MTTMNKDFRGMTAEQKLRAEQLINLFENGHPKITEEDYAKVEIDQDKRGYTAGRTGFTTFDGDALDVINLYIEKKQEKGEEENILSPFVEELKRLKKDESGDTRHLEKQGFPNAWKEAAEEQDFRDAQDEIIDKKYYQPSADYADELELKTALARAVLYDTIIQHGDSDDPQDKDYEDSLRALLKRTQKKVGGTPKTGIDEKEWLNSFIKVRRDDLLNPYNEDTKEEWEKSVSRCDVFSEIAEDGNYDLQGRIEIHVEPDYPNEIIP